MTTENTLNHSMDSAQKHYSSLFFLPSFKKAILGLAIICIGFISAISFLISQQTTVTLLYSLLLGAGLMAVTLIADVAVSNLVLKKDPIYVIRRTTAFSYFGWVLWASFYFIGAILGLVFGFSWWIKLSFLGFAAVLTLRIMVFLATSTLSFSRKLAAALLQPYLCIAVFMTFWLSIFNISTINFLIFLLITPVAGCSAVIAFLLAIEQLGRKKHDVPAMPFFRAFMLNWVVGLNAPLEQLLEKMGKDEDIEVTHLKFEAKKIKASIIVPLVHPGPFKNIGSSLLPSLLKKHFEEKFSCQACTPLGILGHELDLASQAQNYKIIDQVIDSANFPALSDLATPLLQVSEGAATASCQIFGKTAFLSFTLSPKTTEDLPQELGSIVREEAQKHGLNCAVVVNSHNSINNIMDTEESLDALRVAALNCLNKAVALPLKPFKVGCATVYPKEFSLGDGMGAGGITSVVVEVEKRKTAYIVIDGNNIISGVREKILSALTTAGFDESEVFTTDTHAVSAVVTGRRGYHPVGEVMDFCVLNRYITEVAKAAESNLEPCKAGCLSFVVPKVRVIGKERIESLSLLVDNALKLAKKIVAPLFALEGALLILLLVLLNI